MPTVFEAVEPGEEGFREGGLAELVETESEEDQDAEYPLKNTTEYYDCGGVPKKRVKFAYLLGSANLCLITFWMGSSPATFYRLYCIKAVLLLLIRWMSYKKQKMHYYMFDFCYAVNGLLVMHLLFWPKSSLMYKIVFAHVCGPLASSVIVFGNSLVYHKLDEFTSLFIHWYPLLVVWTLQWYPRTGSSPDMTGNDASGVDLVLWPMLTYTFWAIFYYIKIFVISPGKIKEREYETLYQWMMSDPHGICPKLLSRFPARWQPLSYMAVHFFMVLVSLMLGLLCWKSFVTHSTLVALTTAASMWNGASHYLS